MACHFPFKEIKAVEKSSDVADKRLSENNPPASIAESDQSMRLFCPIAKISRTPNGVMVYGWGSVSDYVDDQDEIVDPQALREAVEEWKSWRNIRLMHQPEPIGVAPIIEIRPHPATGHDALWLGAHIVDQRAIGLIEAGVLKGFSIGGQCLEKSVETVDVPSRR